MNRHLPPLNQLRAFEAAARLGSFKAAGDELNVTHAAISHQIKALEALLGLQLFLRMTRKVEPTQEARRYAAELGAAFDRMDGATQALRKTGAGRTLRLTAAPFYGNRVVIHALPDFLARHPEIDVDISLDYSFVDIRGQGYDAGLRYGTGDWPGMTAIKINSDVITPVAAPDLVAGRDLPLSAHDIAGLPLAADRMSRNQWQVWFDAAGQAMPPDAKVWEFDNRAMVLDFALAGNGVVLTDIHIAHSELAQGSLVRLHPRAVEMPTAMYLAFPKTSAPDPRVIAFADWLRQMTAAMDLEIGNS